MDGEHTECVNLWKWNLRGWSASKCCVVCEIQVRVVWAALSFSVTCAGKLCCAVMCYDVMWWWTVLQPRRLLVLCWFSPNNTGENRQTRLTLSPYTCFLERRLKTYKYCPSERQFPMMKMEILCQPNFFLSFFFFSCWTNSDWLSHNKLNSCAGHNLKPISWAALITEFVNYLMEDRAE